MNWWRRSRQRLARHALDLQLDYQSGLARRVAERGELGTPLGAGKNAAAAELLSYVDIRDTDCLLEVGPGARGLLFYLPPGGLRARVDPLAVEYRALFPNWTKTAPTSAAFGEALPFRDDMFDLVVCDNVIDHAEKPFQIVRELVRVLKPNGTLYFTVHVHHPVYHAIATTHTFLNALGVPFEIEAFAAHTVHLTIGRIRRFLASLPLEKKLERSEVRKSGGNLMKRVFYKNADYVFIATKAISAGAA